MRKAGKKFSNAETNIDVKKKEVSFRYPNEKYNENLSFFTNGFYIILGLVVGAICGLRLPIMWANKYNYDYFIIDPTAVTLILFMIIYGVGGLILFGYISLFLHKYSKAARDSFPKTNAIALFPRQRYKINLEHKISKVHIIEGKKLILFDYSISFFQYCYIGYNKIERIITKSVEHDKDKEHYDFIIIFLFEKPIKEGYLYYKT